MVTNDVAGIAEIPIISVSYNSPELIKTLLSSLRQYYPNKVFIIDGSEAQPFEQIQLICGDFADVELIHFDYNIHHGPGMAWAFQNLDLNGRVLVLDSDVVVVHHGFIESLAAHLKPGMYGAGYVGIVNEEGFDLDLTKDKGIPYLHPACMLCNIDVVRQWPMPVKHGAPLTKTMIAIHNAQRPELLARVDWLHKDFRQIPPVNYLIHDWQGTVKTVKSYELDEWLSKARQRKILIDLVMGQIPKDVTCVAEIGENDGLLSRALKDRSKNLAHISIQNKRAKVIHQKVWSDQTKLIDLDEMTPTELVDFSHVDCWVLDRCVENSKIPSKVYEAVAVVCKPTAIVISVIPNAQYWKRLIALIKGNPLDVAEDGIETNPMFFAEILRLHEENKLAITGGLFIGLAEKPSSELEQTLFKLTKQPPSEEEQFKKIISAEWLLLVSQIKS